MLEIARPQKKNALLQIRGLQDSNIAMTKGCVEIDLVSLHDPNIKLPAKAYVLEKLTAPWPTERINETHFSHLKNAGLVYPNFFIPNDIDMILGSDYFFSILLPGQITCAQSNLIAQNSIFGFLVSGKLTESLNSNSMLNLHINGTSIDNQLKQFWELEEIPNLKDRILTFEEQFVETHFQNTYTFNSDGQHSSHDTRVEFSKDSNESSKVLGFFWSLSNDTFGFQPSLEFTPPLTKRRILSESSKIFNPLGLLSPYTVFMKIFYQKLWLTKTDWDSSIPQQLTDDWLKFQETFNEINYLTVPRWVILTADNTVELHGFADASSLAYAAAIYCRQKPNGKIKIQLLVSKTEVTPVKQVSTPRLELCGAHLLSKLFKSVLCTLKHYTFDVFACTDSKIVLSWLSSHPGKWKTFVANRTSEIIEVLPTKH
ncbi:uncharacterized protein TNCT_641861 [Trichonephila clavata]|uniref:Peptidase aspartic putative domain-containing protein n=1 Tax=Trichonephila clavata TaxID=2740835 RepID=A0A8X6J3V4_TRICU|nr:uncharacterized protein TNCT_641861 [Trichonephila clavata]